jgi:electron transfer DM13
MLKKLALVLAVLVVVGGAGAWYAFRPERLLINQRVNEQFPTASAASNKLATGQFHSGAHETKGTATLFGMADGKRTLRLTDFATSNGPDVHVYLVAANDAKDNDTVTKAGFLDLGSLKGNIGDQNYDLPANTDLAKYRAVTIWCKRFSVNFGTAPLMNDSMQSMNR